MSGGEALPTQIPEICTVGSGAVGCGNVPTRRPEMHSSLMRKATRPVAESSDGERCPVTGPSRMVEPLDVGPGDTVPAIEGGQLPLSCQGQEPQL